MELWANIAVLLKAKDLNGGLFVKATEGLPFLLSEGLEVTFVPPVLRVPRSARVSQVVHTHDDRWIVYFEGITSREVTEQLVGHYCLVRRSDVPAEVFHQRFSLAGFMVVDGTHGKIGQVVRVEENPAHPLLVVKPSPRMNVSLSSEDIADICSTKVGESNANDSDEYLIPLVDAFIQELNNDEKILILDLPEGLLEL